jgi:phospholipid/cholesterol/gamma-HCH transport system ATP-binding protein
MGSDNQKLTDFIFASDLLKNMRRMVIENGLHVMNENKNRIQ